MSTRNRPGIRPAPIGLLLLLATARAVGGPDFTPVGTDATGNKYAADLERAVRDNGLLLVTVRTEYAEPRRIASADKPVFTAIDQMAVDCAAGTFAVMARRYVANDGTAIPGWVKPKAELTFKPAAAGSMSELLVQAICGAAGPPAATPSP